MTCEAKRWQRNKLLTEAERAGDQRGIAEALGALGHTLGWQGRFNAAEEVLMRSVTLATAPAPFSWTSQSLALLATLDACRGHLVSARIRWAQAAASSPHHDPMIGRCGAFIELLAGDLAMAEAHARQADDPDPASSIRLAGPAGGPGRDGGGGARLSHRGSSKPPRHDAYRP